MKPRGALRVSDEYDRGAADALDSFAEQLEDRESVYQLVFTSGGDVDVAVRTICELAREIAVDIRRDGVPR